jgi:outer membrane protein TolC
MKRTILFSILLAFTTTLQAQDSLMNYLEIAAKNNPTVLQKLAEYEASLQKIPQVSSLPDPELSAGVFLSPMEVVNGKQIADFRLMQMFPWFGTLKAAKDEMSLMAKAKFESLREAKLQVFYNVQRTWYELEKTEQSILISEKNLAILHTIERLSLAKFKSAATSIPISAAKGTMSKKTTSEASGGMSKMGENTRENAVSNQAVSSAMQTTPMGGSDLANLYQVQMEIGELENNILLLKNQGKNIAAKFNGYLNRNSKTPVNLTGKISTDSPEYDLTTISDSMINRNPMLGMLKYEQQSLDARRQMVTKMGYPMLGLGLNYSVIQHDDMAISTPGMNGKDMVMPMFTVTIPIYRKKYKAMQKEIALQKKATGQDYQASSNALQTEHYEAIQFYQDARRRIKLYENQVDMANKSQNILLKSFSANGTGLIELLHIQQVTLDYELRQVEAITDNNTAIAWLKRLGNFELQ